MRKVCGALKKYVNRELGGGLKSEVFGFDCALKKPVDLSVDSVDDRTEVLRFVDDVEVVYVDDEQLSLLIGRNPGLIALVQAAEVIDADGILELSSTAVNLTHQGLNARPEIDQ